MRKKSNQRCHLYYILSFISSLLLLRVKIINSQNHSCNSDDLSSLRSFYDGLESKAVLDWSFNDSSSDCCNWVGVRCDSLNSVVGSRVSGIFLSNNSLKGFLYDSFTGGFDRLKYIDLSYNSLYGSVPSSLFQLPQLESLDLSSNSFSGAIPPSLNLPSIQVFNISFNQFNGSLPILPGSRNLREFDVTGNSFYGNITSSMCIYSGMVQVLRFSVNKLFGDFPAGYGNCTGLIELSLDMNGLTGTLPDDLFNLLNLTKLNLQGNSLTGSLSPPKFGNLANLVEIDLSANNFSGTIPDVFDKLKKLETLWASSNGFSGLLPLSLSNCSTLKVLSLRNNSLIGNINLNFSSLSKLNTLDLGTNRFTGKIPFNLPECKQMKTLNLARNNLVGEIPSSFVNFTSISYLSLTGNKFSNLARALQILQNLPNLTILVLTKNFQSGETMPSDGINGFLNMEVFVMANCALEGSIPPWLANLNKLNVLDISWNHLTGTVPPWLGNFDHLFYLDISNNSLNGQIPASLTHMKNLVPSSNSEKQRASFEELPFFVRRNSTGKPLQYNQVSSFPPSLILSHNKLVGSISPGFSNLRGLLVLDLSYNNLTGTIPNNLSGMSNLETLDLSHNDLTGAIPASLTKLNFLSKFDVAYNNLTGEIPTGGQFSAFPPDYFEGNPGLCGSHFKQCHQVNVTAELMSKKYINKGVIIGPVIGIGIGVVAFVALFFLVSRIKSRAQERNSKAVANADDSSSENEASKLVILFQNKDASKDLTIEDILKSTNNFDQGFIVGCGGFGLVYKGTLPSGRRVAIKRLSGDFCQIEREFQAEVETLSRVQHENLVLLEGYCKVGTDRLLIYSFMENGSLDYWLHEKPDGPVLLDWPKRLHIARGSARGLCYLHQSCDPHILHRDIKSSNILLDGSFNAHLADFGLARLILPYDTHVTTDVVGTLGYIPPEYGQSPLATFKGDVYSFGVVLLELITGRRPVDMCQPRGSRDVVSWVVQMKAEGRKEEAFDEIITSDRGNLGSFEQAARVLEIACLCVAESPKLRPLAYQLVAWLDEIGADGK